MRKQNHFSSIQKKQHRDHIHSQNAAARYLRRLDSKAKMVVVSMALTSDQDRASNYPGPVELLRANCY
jgi:hypothetical protein